jgi:hypothetical protein
MSIDISLLLSFLLLIFLVLLDHLAQGSIQQLWRFQEEEIRHFMKVIVSYCPLAQFSLPVVFPVYCIGLK